MSQRIDLFTEDFAMTALKSGARSLTLAIESASPRGRRVLNKNLTEQQILNAFEIAFKLGFAKIKIYNIANVPFETQEDIDYYAVLAEKFDALKKKYNAKTQIRWSYTPFQAKNCTSLQWAPYSGISLDENGYPVFKKTLNSAYEAFKKYDQMMRVGTNSDISLVAQSLTYGDRRMWNTIKYCHENKILGYAGGMGIGKNKITVYTDAMKQASGLGWDYFIREKDEDEVFAWDNLDTGVTKAYFLEVYKDAKKAAHQPLTEEGMLRPNCRDQCTLCGCCQNPKLPKFTRPNHNDDNVDLQEIFNYVKPKKTANIRVQLYIKPEYRYIHQSKIIMRLRKTLINAGIPTQRNIQLASNKIIAKAWSCGLEVAQVQLKDISFHMTEKEMLKAMQDHCDPAFEIVRVEKYSNNLGSLMDAFDTIIYSLDIPKLDYGYGDIKEAIKTNYTEAESCIVKVKAEGTARDQIVSIPFEAKAISQDMWCVDKGEFTRIYSIMTNPSASLYDLLPVVIKTTKANILKYVMRVEDMTLSKAAGELSMFSAVCTECGEEIQDNIFGEPVSEDFCTRHKYQ